MHIKYLYEYKEMSLRAIATETGYSFRTVKKYANKEDDNQLPTSRKPKQSKLDPLIFLSISLLGIFRFS
jgi:transposase